MACLQHRCDSTPSCFCRCLLQRPAISILLLLLALQVSRVACQAPPDDTAGFDGTGDLISEAADTGGEVQPISVQAAAAAAVGPKVPIKVQPPIVIPWPPVALWPPIIVWPGFFKTPRRYSIKYINDLPSTDRYKILFFLAVRYMQQNVTGDLSFGAVANIHGSATPYNNTCVCAPCGPGAGCAGTKGYCPHGSSMFASWHRPYLWQYELALIEAGKIVAASFVNGTEKAAYQSLATKLRVPFLNPAAAFTSAPGFTIMTSATVSIDDPSDLTTGLVSIPNPLLSFASSFRSASWKTTLNTNALSYANQFTNFVTLGGTWDCSWSGGPCAVTSLEDTHGTIHVNIGGSMGSVPTAAKDPIFMFHHANIDRILQAWQGFNPLAWWTAGNVEPYGNYYFAAGAAISAASVLAPFRVGTAALVDSNYARTMHGNFFVRNRYSYVHTNVTGARRLGHRRLQQTRPNLQSFEKTNRELAAQVLAELTQLQPPESFRLQYKLTGLDVDQTERPFCLSFILGGADVVKQYLVPAPADGSTLVRLPALMEAREYCGVHCTFKGDHAVATTSAHTLRDIKVDVSRCLLQLGIQIPPGRRPYMGPTRKTNPVRLSNFTILASFASAPQQSSGVDSTLATGRDGAVGDFNDDVVLLAPELRLPEQRELGWWKLLLQTFPGQRVQVVNATVSMATGLPTQYVPASRVRGVGLPGAAAGVSDVAPFPGRQTAPGMRDGRH